MAQRRRRTRRAHDLAHELRRSSRREIANSSARDARSAASRRRAGDVRGGRRRRLVGQGGALARQTRLDFVWGPALTLIVTIVFLCNCWRDVKRLFFNNMPKTKSHHTAAVIWLHGTGDAGAGFAFLKKACERELRHIKWVLPDAPRTPLTRGAGARRRARGSTSRRCRSKSSANPTTPRASPSPPTASTGSSPPRSPRASRRRASSSVASRRAPPSPSGRRRGRRAAQIAGVVAWSGYALCADELPRCLEPLAQPQRGAPRLPRHARHQGAPRVRRPARHDPPTERRPRHAAHRVRDGPRVLRGAARRFEGVPEEAGAAGLLRSCS